MVAFFAIGWALTASESLPLPDAWAHYDAGLLRRVLAYDSRTPLLFNTGLFLLLFTGFIGIYQLASRWRTAKMLIVIAFSLYFYWKSSAECCFILLGVCLADYVVGWLLGQSRPLWLRKLWVTVNVAANVGMLVYFKYFNMLYESFADITGRDFEAMDIILPAGISFFCFRSISYIVDIYRRKIEPCTSLLDYIFFLTYFPPLLAGPVVRAADMLPQIKANNPATRQMVSDGLFLIICGLVKKVMVADYLSGNFVSRIFENPSLYSGFENLMGAMGFAIQLYCDFSGYSDMAIGLALLMGYRFRDNFDAPFKSQSPTELWRRWHISLSSWLRDYIYIPLGGNRKGKRRQHINLMATMTIGGLWHGATWMYVIWGAYNGALLIIHKWLHKRFPAPSRLKGTRPAIVFNITVTLALTVFGFMIFRATSLDNIGLMLRQIFTDFRPAVIPAFLGSYALITAIIVGAYVMHFLPRRATDGLRRSYGATHPVVQALILALILFAVIQSRQSELVPFVYLQY